MPPSGRDASTVAGSLGRLLDYLVVDAGPHLVPLLDRASRAGPRSMVPALLTMMSSRPSPATACSTAPEAGCWLVTSAGTARAVPPSVRIAAASPYSRSRRRAASARAAPSAASRRAVAAPIPAARPGNQRDQNGGCEYE
jgi:hypothetical protein